jgi:hypothetical protein
MRKKYDIWNVGRQKIIDQALKFILDNLVPDYLKFEFEIFHVNPKYKFNEVDKLKKLTKYQMAE